MRRLLQIADIIVCLKHHGSGSCKQMSEE